LIPSTILFIASDAVGHASEISCSLDTILEILKKNDFEITDDVNSAEVSAFVSWVESAEQPDE
jgi:hypothetical protein